MSKYFKTDEEFDSYINDLYNKKIEGLSLIDAINAGPMEAPEIIDALIRDGYTDLDNLVEDGHAYEIGGHKNNGWLYADETDLSYLEVWGSTVEIRERRA